MSSELERTQELVAWMLKVATPAITNRSWTSSSCKSILHILRRIRSFDFDYYTFFLFSRQLSRTDGKNQTFSSFSSGNRQHYNRLTPDVCNGKNVTSYIRLWQNNYGMYYRRGLPMKTRSLWHTQKTKKQIPWYTSTCINEKNGSSR